MTLVIDVTVVKFIQNTSGLRNAWEAFIPAAYDVISATHRETWLPTRLSLSMHLSIGTALVMKETRSREKVKSIVEHEKRSKEQRDDRAPFYISASSVTPSDKSVMQGLVC